jgi:hypothetical protein
MPPPSFHAPTGNLRYATARRKRAAGIRGNSVNRACRSIQTTKGEVYWAKYHLRTLQGIQNLTREEPTRLAGDDPDYGRRVAKGLVLDVSHVERLAAVIQEDRVKATAE